METKKKSSSDHQFVELGSHLVNDSRLNKGRVIVWVCLIIALAVVAIFASCSASHRVSQSASTFKSGDTLTTTIIYHQTGKFKK